MFYQSNQQIDQLAGTLQASGSAVVVNVQIDCHDGYELSCDSVSNLTVEAKHSGDVGYTNIETTPIDLSSYAGSRETFNLRFTPSSTTGVYSFRFRSGPAVPPVEYTIVYNDDENEIYNDDEELIYAEV